MTLRVDHNPRRCKYEVAIAMLEKGEVEFELDERNCTTTVVVEPLLKHMRLTKFPFVVGSEQAVISPPLEKVLEILDSGATIGA